MRLIFLCMSIVLLQACKKSDSNTGATLAPVNSIDVPYGTDGKQKMDLYLPAGRSASSTKLMVMIHGGGWTEGDKGDFSVYVATLQKRFPDYAFANINYRLAANGQNLFPSQEEDVKAAVAFIFSKRDEYQVSDKWVLLGASAGAHLAMLQAYKYNSPVRPKAVVSFFGPSELISFFNQPNPVFALAMLGVTGTTPSLNPGLYQQSSPYNFITAQSPPTILLHGGADPLVPPAQSTMVRDKLQMLGVASQYVFYPTGSHGWEGADLVDSFDKIGAFLKLHVE